LDDDSAQPEHVKRLPGRPGSHAALVHAEVVGAALQKAGPVGSHATPDLGDRLAGVVAESGHVLQMRLPPVPVGPDGRIGLGRDGNMIRRL
jgi:hypothetical protein